MGMKLTFGDKELEITRYRDSKDMRLTENSENPSNRNIMVTLADESKSVDDIEKLFKDFDGSFSIVNSETSDTETFTETSIFMISKDVDFSSKQIVIMFNK